MIIWLYLLSILSVNRIEALHMNEDTFIADNIDHYIDPNDMLTYPASMKNKLTADLKDKKLYLEDECGLHKEKIRSLTKELNDCSLELISTRAHLKQTSETINFLQDNHTNDVNPAVNTFYIRLLKSFWNLLEMEAMEDSLAENEQRLAVLQASISLHDITTFKSIFNRDPKHSEIDEFFLKFKTISPTEERSYFWKKWMQSLANLEIWLFGLGALVVLLSCWAFSLYLIDFQRKRRWTGVLGMIFVLLFVISCAQQWRIMVKNVEAKKRSEETRVSPEECFMPQSNWELIRISIFGGENKCEQYHRQLLLDAPKEVTPLMAISATTAIFFLQPLQNFGTYIGLFFNNFYDGIPIVWVIPATVVLCVMLSIVLFAAFGYGIEFPFWLGGIKPISASRTDERKLKQILEENRKHLREERISLLNEAKDMLRDISLTAISHTQRIQNETIALHPFFASSAEIIERQLEQIVSNRFKAQLEPHSNVPSTDMVDYTRTTTLPSVTNVNSHSQDEFVAKIKNILDESTHSDGSYSSKMSVSVLPTPDVSDCSQSNGGDSQNEFFNKVKHVMTP